MNEPVEVLGVLDPNGLSFYVLDLNSHMDSYMYEPVQWCFVD